MAVPAAVLQMLVTANTTQATAALTKFDAQAKKTAASTNATSAAMGNKLAKAAKVGGVALVAGVAYGLAKSVSAGAEFEKQMDSLSAVTGASTKDMVKLEKQALKLGEATFFSANETAKAQTELAKGGLNVKQILGGGLRAALLLAEAGELGLAEASETTVNAMKLFGLRGKDTVQIANMLATAANKTTADVGDFAMALKQGGSVAKTAGLSLNDTVTVLEALAEAGIKNSDAGTSMKTAFIQLLKPSTKQAELTKELGLNFVTQNGTMKDAVGISKELHRVTDGMTKAERAKVLATLAGTDGFRTLSALYDAGPKKLEALTKANEKQGTAQEIAAKKMDNLSGDWEQFMGALETAGIKIFKVLSPALRDATQKATELTQAAMHLDFGAAKKEVEGIIKSLKTFWRESGVTRSVVVEAWRVIRDVVKDSVGAMIQIVKGWVQVIRGIVKVISGILTGDFGRVWEGVQDIFAGGVKSTVGVFRGITAPVRRIAATAGGAIKDAFSFAWDKIEGVFEAGRDKAIGFINDLIDAINALPFIPDIDKIGSAGGMSEASIRGEGRKGSKGLHQQHRQRGGILFGGKASGDSIPAMLERGEYVLNRKAVEAVGPKQLDALNFGIAPRFQGGGVAKLQVGGFGLPSAESMGGVFSSMAPWLLDQATDWVKGKKKKFGSFKGIGPLGGGSVAQNLREAIGIGSRHGSGVSSFQRPGTGGSYHDPAYAPPHQAVDLAGGNMMATAKGILRAFGAGKILELFYNPLGFQVDNYRKGPMTVFDHYDHVHVAFQKGGKVGGLPSWVHGSSRLNADQLASLAHYVGMPNPGLMAQIAQAESSGDPGVTNSIGARGLWQIIPSTAQAFGLNYSSLTDPLANAKGAAQILAGQGLGAWEGFTNGSYAKFPKGTISPLVGGGGGKAAAAKAKVKRIAKIGAAKIASLPALGPTPLLPSAKGLAPGIKGMLRSPGLRYAGKVGISEIALERAEKTQDTADDMGVLAFQEELFKRRKQGLQRQLRNINAALGKKGLTPKQRAKLFGKREHVLAELSTVEGQLGGVRSTRAGLNEEEGGESEAEEKQREAIEENTRALEEHKAEEESLRKELEATRHIAESELAVSSAVARRAFADIIAGQLGPRSSHRANTAGHGTVGSM